MKHTMEILTNSKKSELVIFTKDSKPQKVAEGVWNALERVRLLREPYFVHTLQRITKQIIDEIYGDEKTLASFQQEKVLSNLKLVECPKDLHGFIGMQHMASLFRLGKTYFKDSEDVVKEKIITLIEQIPALEGDTAVIPLTIHLDYLDAIQKQKEQHPDFYEFMVDNNLYDYFLKVVAPEDLKIKIEVHLDKSPDHIQIY